MEVEDRSTNQQSQRDGSFGGSSRGTPARAEEVDTREQNEGGCGSSPDSEEAKEAPSLVWEEKKRRTEHRQLLERDSQVQCYGLVSDLDRMWHEQFFCTEMSDCQGRGTLILMGV